MSGVPDVPPWEPIADWLLRMDDSVPEHKQNRPVEGTEYERDAKAIAYDIATHGTERFDPEEIKRDLREETPRQPVEVCPKCEGHGGIPGDVCGRCDGTGRIDGGSNV